MPRKPVLIATVAVLLAATVAGCGADQEQGQQQEDGAAPERTATEETLGGTVEETQEGVGDETTVMEGTVAEGATTAVPDVVSVGGFTVERPDGAETTVPQLTAERQDVESYQAQVRPIIEGTVRDVSDLVQADVSLQNGNLSLDVEVASLEEARQSTRDGLEQLREVDPPEDLEPIHQHLISAYEQVLPAYDEIIEAADSGDPRRMSDAVRENLPRIEAFNEETRAILQDLDQAATSQ